MKRLLLSLVFMLVATAGVINATEIQVGSSQWFPSAYRYSGSVATLRIYYSASFISNTNVNVVGGAIGSNGWFLQVPCAVTSNTLNCASFTLQSTVDSNKPNTRFFAVLYDQSGARRETLMGDASGWIVPASPTSTTVAQLLNAQGTGIVNPPVSYLNSSQVQTLINTAVGTLNDASDIVKGKTKLSVAPVSATIPIAVGANDPRIPTSSGTGIVYVSQFAGADIGAKIVGADASCGANPCTIYVDVQGAITTHVILNSYHTLWFGLGDWTTTTADASPFDLKSFTTVKGSGWGTRIAESTTAGNYYLFLNQTLRLVPGNVDKYVNISDLQIIGANAGENGAFSTIALGNCLHCSVRNVFLNDTSAIGISVGTSSTTSASLTVSGASNTNPIIITTSTPHNYETGEETTIASVGGNTNANGKFLVTVTDSTHFTIPVSGNAPYISGGTAKRNAHAIDVTVSGCRFFKVATQNLALVNGKNIHFDNNTFRAAGDPAANPAYIDLEPNTASDWIEDFTISNNILDGSQAPFYGVAIAVQSTIGGTQAQNGIVSNNVIKGPLFARGIDCNNYCSNIEITGNWISTTTQPAIILEPCTGCTVTNNTIVNTGAAGNEAISVSSGSTLCNISRNFIRVNDGGSSLNIGINSSVSNTFLDNVGATYSTSSATTLIRDNNGIVFANLPTAKNGSEAYCSDCTKTTPCAGGGTGAKAKYLNGAKDCN